MLSCSVILHACLRNTDGTACYMNAALLVLLWALYQDPTFNAGPLAANHRSLALGPATFLLKNMIWKALLGNGAQPNRQHDMHELLPHLMPRLRLDEVKETWQTCRLEDAGVVICNSADTTLPITLDVPCEVRGLQHCVQSWHSQ